jgi:hypothetical protein
VEKAEKLKGEEEDAKPTLANFGDPAESNGEGGLIIGGVDVKRKPDDPELEERPDKKPNPSGAKKPGKTRGRTGATDPAGKITLKSRTRADTVKPSTGPSSDVEEGSDASSTRSSNKRKSVGLHKKLEENVVIKKVKMCKTRSIKGKR